MQIIAMAFIDASQRVFGIPEPFVQQQRTAYERPRGEQI
jgi:hypothetical protein